MTYDWEQFPGKNGVERGRNISTHVRFSKDSSQIYVSTKLLRQEASNLKGLISSDEIGKRRAWAFDLLVDKEKRVFAMKFHDKGIFHLRTEPGQVSVGSFISQFKPVRNRRIHMRYDEKEAAWIGSLDGKAVPSETKSV